MLPSTPLTTKPQKNMKLSNKTLPVFTISGLGRIDFNSAELQADQSAIAQSMPPLHGQLIQFGGSYLVPRLKKQ